MQTLKIKCLLSFLLMAAVPGVLFFSSSSGVQVTEMSSYGIIAEDHVWKKESISVCWAEKEQAEELNQFSILRTVMNETTKEIGDQDKSLIQNKVQEQFNKNTVGIEFVGWQRCDPLVKADIYIFAFDEMTYAEYYPPGEADVGTSCEMFNPEVRKKEIRTRVADQPGYLFLSKARIKTLVSKGYKNPEVSFVRAALHEFGHVAGLLHEHYHKDAQNDPNCQEFIKADPTFTVNPVSLGQEKAYSAYDPKSIMNACFVIKEDEKEQQNLAEVRLSELDLHSLQCIYKSAEQFDKTKCPVTEYK